MEGLTRKRKWMMGLLALGVGALVMDRTLLGPPEEASASQAPSADAAPADPSAGEATPAPAAPAPDVDAPADLSEFAQRLSALPAPTGDGLARDDAFALPADWREAPLEGPSAVAEVPIELSQEARAFKLKYTHQGTMNIDGTLRPDGTREEDGFAIAVINDKPCRVGAVVDGFVLIRIGNQRSLWQQPETGEMVLLTEVQTP